MTIQQLGEQAGQVTVNLAPFLGIIGMAMTAGEGGMLESMLDLLFCDPAEL